MPIPAFITELRSMIGHHPLWLPGVSALVLDDEGRVLLGQRADLGHWALPSGIPEPGEAMATACAREVLEETGVRVVVRSLIAISTTPEVTYPNGDVTRYVAHLFGAEPVGGEAYVADDESLAVGWFDPQALPEPIAPSVARALALGATFAATGTTSFDT